MATFAVATPDLCGNGKERAECQVNVKVSPLPLCGGATATGCSRMVVVFGQSLETGEQLRLLRLKLRVGHYAGVAELP